MSSNEEDKTVLEMQNDPRFKRAKSLIQLKRYEEAVESFADLLQIVISGENNDEECLKVAPLYYEYGNSLLFHAENSADVFGDQLEKAKEIAQAAMAGGNSGDIEASDPNSTGSDDFELAWEMLEVARVIYSRYIDKSNSSIVEKELARVYMRLGDLSMESGVFEQAKSDYNKSLLIQKKLLSQDTSLNKDTTPLADLYCCLAIASIYHQANEEEKKRKNENIVTAAPMEENKVASDEGLKFYTLAGNVMAENIHRQAKLCSNELQKLIRSLFPAVIECNEEVVSKKGKGKKSTSVVASGAEVDVPDYKLEYFGTISTENDEFIKCALSARSVDVSLGKVSLLDEEKKLLEYLEIYTELKEKVDGLRENKKKSGSIVNEGFQSEESKKDQSMNNGVVSTIGFGASASVPSERVNDLSANLVVGRKKKSKDLNDKNTAIPLHSLKRKESPESKQVPESGVKKSKTEDQIKKDEI